MGRHGRHKAGPPELWASREQLQAGQISWSPRKLVLVDIDGTLSNPGRRLHLVRGPGRKDWDSFFDQCDRDPPVEAVVRWTRALADQFSIVLVSGRPMDKAGAKTVWWLHHFRVPFDHLFLRRGGDRRPDTVTKQEILNDILRTRPKESIEFAIDDRLSVVEQVWRKSGIRVFPVRAGEEDFY